MCKPFENVFFLCIIVPKISKYFLPINVNGTEHWQNSDTNPTMTKHTNVDITNNCRVQNILKKKTDTTTLKITSTSRNFHHISNMEIALITLTTCRQLGQNGLLYTLVPPQCRPLNCVKYSDCLRGNKNCTCHQTWENY